MEYNTIREPLIMKEYGRHIQNMVDYVVAIEDKNKRQEQAEVLIELMGFLNPHLKNVEDFRHKLWDHLFYMSGFKLEVDSPYPKPTKENYKEKPNPIPYPNQHGKYAHLGKNIDSLIKKAIQEEDPEIKLGLTHAILYYIKLAYSNWHKEIVSDEAALSELKSITHGQLDLDEIPKFKYKPTLDTTTNNKWKANFNGKSRNQQPGQKQGGNKNKNNNGNNNRRNNGSGNNNNFKRKFIK